jgi:hypothetical protein
VVLMVLNARVSSAELRLPSTPPLFPIGQVLGVGHVALGTIYELISSQM